MKIFFFQIHDDNNRGERKLEREIISDFLGIEYEILRLKCMGVCIRMIHTQKKKKTETNLHLNQIWYCKETSTPLFNALSIAIHNCN